MKKGLLFAGASLLMFGITSCKECKTCNITTLEIVNGDTTTTTESAEFCNTNLENVENRGETTPFTEVTNEGKVYVKWYTCTP